MPLNYEPVAIPVVKGIDVNTKARLIEPPALLEAINSRISGGGSSKRPGHAGRRIRGSKSLPLDAPLPLYSSPPGSWAPYYTGDRGIPSDWLFGWGPVLSNSRVDNTTALETSPHPDAGLVFGTAKRDNEALMWNGHSLFSHNPQQDAGAAMSTVSPAVIPAMKARPVAKSTQAQTKPDAAETSRVRVVAWVQGSAIKYAVYDAVTEAVIIPQTSLPGLTTPQQVRCIAVGGWVHMLVHDSTGNTLQLRSVQENSPGTVVSRSLGSCTTYFDAWKVSESSWVTVRNTGSLTLGVVWLNADGGTSISWTPAINGGLATLTSVAIAVHPVSGGVGIVWRGNDGTNRVWARCYDAQGAALAAVTTIASPTTNTARPVAIAPKYLLDSSGGAIYNAYWDDGPSSIPEVRIGRFSPASASPLYTTVCFRFQLASQAFRVGDRTFVWAGYQSALQSVWVLLDESLLQVGQLDYAVANVPAFAAGTAQALASVNWYGTAPVKDVFVHRVALGFRVRVSTDDPTVLGTNQALVYTEPSIRYAELDFLPPLRSAQAGRATYFAGSQLWSYDGTELVESGFLIAPEGVTLTPAAGGNLGTTTKHIWRVDLCYRNAQNEEVRSHSFFTSELTFAGVDEQATLTIPTCPTRRTNSYFLVFRNQDQGTNWYLVNSRDPSSSLFRANDQTVKTVTLTDDGLSTPTDDALLTRELHPGNAGFQYAQPYAAPACEIVASGHGRLWLAGGEIDPGEVHPSRLFEPTETPTFNPVLAVRIDRSADPITAIGFVGEHRAFFRRGAIYSHDGDGPSNVLDAAWATPTLTPADTGAVSPEGLALIPQGLLFQSPAGFRLLGPAVSGITDVGNPVDRVAKTMAVSGCFLSDSDQEVRWYSRSGDALVWNYQYNTWTTWTVRAAGALRGANGLAILGSPDGYVLTETPGLYTDNGSSYLHRVRFPWLRGGGLLDFQAVKLVGGIGESTPAAPHTVNLSLFYNEREFPEEVLSWNYPVDGTAAVHATLNTATDIIAGGPVVKQAGGDWSAILEWIEGGDTGNLGSLHVHQETGAFGTPYLELRDNQATFLGGWIPAPGTVGIFIQNDVLVPVTTTQIEALFATSALVRVLTPDPSPGEIAAVDLNHDGDFSGGADSTSSWVDNSFGDSVFGDGAFGDVNSATGDIRDAVWEWERQPSRRKCSVISVAVDDNSAENAGFTLTALALLLGKKPGLNRGPWRGGSSTTPAGTATILNGR